MDIDRGKKVGGGGGVGKREMGEASRESEGLEGECFCVCVCVIGMSKHYTESKSTIKYRDCCTILTHLRKTAQSLQPCIYALCYMVVTIYILDD